MSKQYKIGHLQTLRMLAFDSIFKYLPDGALHELQQHVMCNSIACLSTIWCLATLSDYYTECEEVFRVDPDDIQECGYWEELAYNVSSFSECIEMVKANANCSWANIVRYTWSIGSCRCENGEYKRSDNTSSDFHCRLRDRNVLS